MGRTPLAIDIWTNTQGVGAMSRDAAWRDMAMREQENAVQ